MRALPGAEGDAGRGGHEELGFQQWRRLGVTEAEGAAPDLRGKGQRKAKKRGKKGIKRIKKGKKRVKRA